MKFPHVAAGLKYAEQVVAGKIPAAHWTRGACERALYDLERWHTKDQPYTFDTAEAERVCGLIERMPHIKGVWAHRNETIVLSPWQSFIITNVFGWKNTKTGYRRFRTVYIECPRKNAKSTLSSTVGLVLLACDDEPGALVVSAATGRAQAKLIFTDAQYMARRQPGFREAFGITVHAHAIAVESTASKFEALSAEDSNLDGLNVHGALIDELHAHRTRGVWDVLTTATGARAQSLLWAITTAGVDRASICFEQHNYVKKILDRHFQNESYFGIIFGTDEGDDWREEAIWRKANPNYGVSIYPDMLANECRKAEQIPSSLNTFLQKHLDVWTSADVAWMPMNAWNACANPKLDLEDFAGQPCFMGIDLATRSDIAAVVVLFPPNEGRDFFAVFGKYYLPERAIQMGHNSQYSGWEQDGLIRMTRGEVTDFDAIIEDIDDLVRRFEVQMISFDRSQSLTLTNTIQKLGIFVPMAECAQTYKVFTPAMRELEALVLQKRFQHDGDPVLAWMISNTIAHNDGNDNIRPTKERPENKIDGVVALLMAVERYLSSNVEIPDYEKRGLWAI
jgi:phage terminase large subunit-like protein